MQALIFSTSTIAGIGSSGIFIIAAAPRIRIPSTPKDSSSVNKGWESSYIGRGLTTEMAVRAEWISQEKILEKEDDASRVYENGGKVTNNGGAVRRSNHSKVGEYASLALVP